MKKIILTFCVLAVSFVSAQDHFGGINTSRRVGLLNVGINPAELPNIKNKFEIQIGGVSLNVSNNKISFNDIVKENDLESKIFAGNESTNASLSTQFAFPGVAFKVKNWSFAVSLNSFVQGNLTDFDANLGRNISVQNNILNTTIGFGSNLNQRFNATTWGEIGFSVGKKVFEKGDHTINAGLTLKLLAPGVYNNFGAERFKGELKSFGPTDTTLYLSNVNNAILNLAYSESSAGSYNDFQSYTSRLFGGINGFGTDFGVNYIWKNTANSYKFKGGFAMRNIGSMTFKGNSNQSTNYSLTIAQGDILNKGLDIAVFDDVTNLAELEQVLLTTPGINFVKVSQQKDFKVNLPTVVNLYADYNITSKFNLTMFMQRRVANRNDNDQIGSENFFSITPRVNLGFFETFVPVSFNEISGTTGGLGFRLGGFYIGSNSILTALISDTKQADAYLGFSFGIL